MNQHPHSRLVGRRCRALRQHRKLKAELINGNVRHAGVVLQHGRQEALRTKQSVQARMSGCDQGLHCMPTVAVHSLKQDAVAARGNMSGSASCAVQTITDAKRSLGVSCSGSQGRYCIPTVAIHSFDLRCYQGSGY